MDQELENTVKKLSEISPSMCLVKWKHATVNLAAQTIKTCCHNFSRKIQSSTDQFIFHDNEADQTIRRQMLEGKKPSECDYCWTMEKTGSYSDRIHWSSQSWMAPFYEEVKNHNSPSALSPSWLEVNFSSTCNLKCSYCNPGYSTSWQEEVQKFGGYPTGPLKHNSLDYFINEGLISDSSHEAAYTITKNNFWVWFKSIVPSVRLLTITGGEPLLSKDTFLVLDHLIENPQPELELAINSNCTLPPVIWEKFVSKVQTLLKNRCIKNIFLHPSLDSWGPRAEYIRHGLNLGTLQKNVTNYLENTSGNLVFNCTINALSLAGLLDYWRYVVDLKKKYGHNHWISSTSELLIFPKWQRIDNLPPQFRKYLEEVRSFIAASKPWTTDHEIMGLDRALNFFDSRSGISDLDLENFKIFFSHHDQRRGTDFKKTFPELHEFFW